MDNHQAGQCDKNWLNDILEEVGLQQFHPKLTNDLQLTKLSHFDYVSEEDLIGLGLSRPAAKRLLAAIKKRKSFVTALKNRIVGKLIPSSSTSPNAAAASRNANIKHHHDIFMGDKRANFSDKRFESGARLETLTCLIKAEDIKLKEEIGHGVHGFVKKGEWTTPSCRVVEVAVKVLRESMMAVPDFVKEVTVMHQLNHPNIIKLHGVVLSKPMMMVLELAPLGNLRNKLREEGGRTSIWQLINFSVQIASGMRYLESERYVHRDLAARNIFVSHERKVLIGDLGLMRAISVHENHYTMSGRTKIPYPWCAPESLRHKQFSSSSDVYMFGVTLWEMFTFGKEPWAKLSLEEILECISTPDKRLPCPEACPPLVYQTLLQCWNVEPALRPKFSTLEMYLSTSYPLMVKSTKHISDINNHKPPSDNTPKNFWSDIYSSLNDTDSSTCLDRKVMTCEIDDRILVIDGQPEKYWWKGQNQRSYEVGWFPLCSTVWLTNKTDKVISKPIKNSFVHTGHCGPDGRWGDPGFIDRMYLKNPLVPDDVNSLSAQRLSIGNSNNSNTPKNKTKSKLSKLFGINDTSHAAHLVNHAYHKFCNEPQPNHFKSKRNNNSNITDVLMTRSQSNVDDEHPLIDFSDENPPLLSSNNHRDANDSMSFATEAQPQATTLIDMDTNFPMVNEFPQKRASESNLSQIYDTANYHLSWAGSWNTGTFDGSSTNIYSAYYCPADASTTAQNQQ